MGEITNGSFRSGRKVTYIQMKNLLNVLKDFISLQHGLLIAFKDKFPGSDFRFLLDIPKTGVVEFQNEKWAFNKHGTGVKFFNGKIVVDVNCCIAGGVDMFDAGRIIDYLESIGNKEIDFTYENSSTVLRKMEEMGFVKRENGSVGEIYSLC